MPDAPASVKPSYSANWPVVVISCATMAVLTVAAFRGAIPWHAALYFAGGVVLPAFRIRVPAGILPAVSEGTEETPPS